MSIYDDVSSVLISEDEIKEIVKRLGAEITRDYEDKKLLVVSVLRGSVVFLADLIREIKCHCQIDFMAVSSYGASTKTSGIVQFKKDIDTDPTGYHILIVEDILDSGLSLKYISEVLAGRNAVSVKICTFLDKPANRKADIKADYVGAEVPDEFIVGYGLDYAEKYRNLPFVGVLDRKVYEGV